MPEGFTSHPSRDQLEAFVRGELNSTDHQAVETHIELCKICGDLLQTLLIDHQKEQTCSASPTVDLADQIEENKKPRSEREKPDTAALDIPATLMDHPRYEILKRLGIGGMGVVYQAQHRLMNRLVALKVINNRLLQNRQMVERFRLEIQAAARLSHRNIVTAFDAEQAGDVHFFVMEFVEGTDLSSIVSRRGQLSVTHASNYIMQAARGLQHAYEQGMVHRDIKPQNLMCTSKGVIKVLDFGLARLAGPQDEENSLTGITAEGITLGTPDYIAPEQARDSRQADIRSDIYSLGCTFYYFLTGRVPFPNGTVMEKVISHCESVPNSIKQLRKDLPDSIVNIIEKMMAKNPADRFQTPKEVADALKPFAMKQRIQGSQTASIIIQEEGTLGDEDFQLNFKPDHQAASEPAPETIVNQADQRLKNKQQKKQQKKILQRPFVLIAGLVGIVVLITSFMIFSRNDNTVNPDTPQQADTQWIDLTQQINLAENVVAGDWQQSGGELHVEAVEWARLALPYSPPAEYDFEVQFTRQSGTQSIAIFFVHGTGQASFELDAWNDHLAGIQFINNQDMRSNSTRLPNQPLQNNQLYTALIKVRHGSVETFLNGERLHLYESDGTDLTLSLNWSLSDTTILGIGAYNSQTIFHRVRVHPIE